MYLCVMSTYDMTVIVTCVCLYAYIQMHMPSMCVYGGRGRLWLSSSIALLWYLR